jgi:hypothetical protein
MNPARRPVFILIVACAYLVVGSIAFVYHAPELLALHRDIVLIELIELLAVIAGAFMLRGDNWARWLALAWAALHVIVSVLDAYRGIVAHCILLVLIAWLLFRPEAGRYFATRRHLEE